MAIVKSQIDITAKDSTAAAFASVNTGLSGLASSALKVSGALSALGATAVIGSFAAFTKQTIDAQDNLSKLAQKTGIAVESLAGLEFAAEQSGVEIDKVAKATRTFSLLVAEAGEKGSASAKKLDQLGLSYKDLKDLSPEKQLLSLADAISKFSKQDQAIAFTSVFGNKMADLIPLLSGGSKELGALIEQGKKFNPVTAQSAKQAELFNDQLNVLSKSFSAIGRGLVQEVIPGLSAVADRMAKVTQESGFLKGALAGVKELFIQSFGNPKILGDVGQIRREIFKTQEVINNLSTKKDSVFFDANALQHEKDKLAQLEIDLQKAIVTSRGVVDAQTANTESTKKFAVALEETAPKIGKQVSAQDALMKAQSKSLDIESEYIKLLNIERKAREDLLKPYQQEAQSAEERLARMRLESAALDLSQRKQISLEQAIEETTIARLEEKRAATTDTSIIAQLEKEIATRKQIVGVIRTSEDRTKQLGRVTSSTTDEVSQLWMQAGRNIQSALANGIFNFFDDGLKGMVKSVVSTVGRIASEFAALKLAQSIGLAGMFGSGAAVAGGIGGGASAGSSALSIASLGSNALSFASGGFGATSLIGGGLQALGGATGLSSVSAFGGGLAGDALGGLAAGGFSSSAAGAASLGASLGAVAGPAIALFAANSLAQYIAGDKTFGNKFTDTLQKIPILGIGANIAAALFGHGPLKFRQQSIQGTASASGFDGDISNVFRAKGGLLVGNKHKTQTEQFSLEQQTLFDDTLKGFYGSAHTFAKNLGLSTDLVDNFTKEVQIKSEKGKQVTEEAIADLLKGIGNSLAQNVLPIVDTFRKAGEDSFATFSRLNTEFVSLQQAAVNLGASTEYAKELVSGLGIATRTAYVEAAGGVDTLIGLTAKFNQNFLTPAEQIAPTLKLVEDGLRDLGQSADLTKDQFKALVQNLTLAGDANALLLLQYQDQFLAVNAYKESLKAASNATKDTQLNIDSTFIALQKSVESEKTKLLESYNKSLAVLNTRIESVTSNIQTLKTLGDALKNTASQINPISLDDARSTLRGAIASSKKGNIIDLSSVAGALSKLAEKDSSGFSTREQFLRSQGQSAELLTKLNSATDSQLTIEERSLNVLVSSRDKLEQGFVSATSRLDELLQSAQDQSDALKGLNTNVVALASAIANFNAASVASGGGAVSTSGLNIKGNPNITSKDIVDFANTHTPIQTYREAIKRGVSSEQIVASGKYTRAEIDSFLRDNKLPSFDVGGIVPKTSIAMVHKGERIINPQQNEALVELLQQLIVATKSGANYSQSVYNLLKNMTNDGLSLKTVAA